MTACAKLAAESDCHYQHVRNDVGGFGLLLDRMRRTRAFLRVGQMDRPHNVPVQFSHNCQQSQVCRNREVCVICTSMIESKSTHTIRWAIQRVPQEKSHPSNNVEADTS
jgi:hypothetical protein